MSPVLTSGAPRRNMRRSWRCSSRPEPRYPPRVAPRRPRRCDLCPRSRAGDGAWRDPAPDGEGAAPGRGAGDRRSARGGGRPHPGPTRGRRPGGGRDCLWLDGRTLAVGLGFRTNRAGLEQLRQAVGTAVDVVPVELPYDQGPEACLHLMSLISLVDDDLAVVYPPLMPVPFWGLLRARGIRLIEVPDRRIPTPWPPMCWPWHLGAA